MALSTEETFARRERMETMRAEMNHLSLDETAAGLKLAAAHRHFDVAEAAAQSVARQGPKKAT